MQLPKAIRGEIIIARECLVDGDLRGDDLETFFQHRAEFISSFYGDYSVEQYKQESLAEFEKIRNIPAHSNIHLWFEDDLFCQVNWWFVVYLLVHFVQDGRVYLIRPPAHTPYGFGGMDETALLAAYERKIPLSELDKIAGLWVNYRNGELKRLKELADGLKTKYPFIFPAVEAHIARLPAGKNPGRPVQTLLTIMDELKTSKFGPVFQAFCEREPIYGFGDLQVKRLYDQIMDER
jgi:hypothetical protein